MRLEKLKLKNFVDERGRLCVLQLSDYVDWQARRIYYVGDVKADRGGHVVKGEKKFYACLQGKVMARFHDGEKWQDIALAGPDEAILMEGDFFREFVDFSNDALLLAVSSVDYNPDDYLYSLEEFIALKKEK